MVDSFRGELGRAKPVRVQATAQEFDTRLEIA